MTPLSFKADPAYALAFAELLGKLVQMLDTPPGGSGSHVVNPSQAP